MEGGRGESEEAFSFDRTTTTQEESLQGMAVREGGKEALVCEAGAEGDVDTEEGGGESGDGSSEVRVVNEGGREGEGEDVLQPCLAHAGEIGGDGLGGGKGEGGGGGGGGREGGRGGEGGREGEVEGGLG